MVKRMKTVLPTATDPDIPRDFPLWGRALYESEGVFLNSGTVLQHASFILANTIALSEWAEFGDRLVDAARQRIEARLIAEARWNLWNAWRWISSGRAGWTVVSEALDDEDEDEDDNDNETDNEGDGTGVSAPFCRRADDV